MSHDAYDAYLHFKRYARTADKEISVISVMEWSKREVLKWLHDFTTNAAGAAQAKFLELAAGSIRVGELGQPIGPKQHAVH